MKIHKKNGDVYEGTPEELHALLKEQSTTSITTSIKPVLAKTCKECPVTMEHGLKKYCSNKCRERGRKKVVRAWYVKNKKKKTNGALPKDDKLPNRTDWEKFYNKI